MDKTFQFPGKTDVTEIVKETDVAVLIGTRHFGKWLEHTNGSASVITFPTMGATPVGVTILGDQNGAGQITFSPAAGVTLLCDGGATIKTHGQYSQWCAFYKGQNVWSIGGYLTVA
jgi:hypothetical protein